MRQWIGIAAASAVMVLALSGCAGTTDGPVEAAGSERQGAPAETVAPLTAEALATPDVELTPEEAYLEAMRARLEEDRPPIEATQIPNASDAQLLDAAADACEQLAAGTEHHNVRVVEGESPNKLGWYTDSADITGYASEFICTDYQL